MCSLYKSLCNKCEITAKLRKILLGNRCKIIKLHLLLGFNEVSLPGNDISAL